MASLWVRSSVPLPMSDLEYDVLAGSYSSGYAAALSTVFHTPVRVLSRRHEGHFYHALAEGGPGCVTEGAPGSSRWESDALPLLHRHFDELRRLAAGSHLDAGELPRLFQQNVFLHHLMLLPIRVRIDCLVADLGSRLASRPEERRAVALDVLDVATSRDFPLPTYLEQLVSEETGAAPSEGAVPLRSVAPDGDGYGIAVPGWLDDETYVVRYRRLLLRLGATSAALRDRALRSATRAADALTRLRQLSERVSLWREVEGLTAVAEQARITELHGPLMHVEYMHRIRGVVLAWGARLAAEDRLDAPEHIFTCAAARAGR